MAGLVSILPLLLALAMAAAASTFHANQNPPAIFVFGDSLSDNGNNNAMPDYYRANYPYYGIDFPGGVATGRVTNGYNFIDIMAIHMEFELSPPPFASITNSSDVLKGVNFASGGSGILVDCMDGTIVKCITMKDQIRNFRTVKDELDLSLGVKAAEELISNSIFIFTCGGNDLFDFVFFKHILDLPSAPIDEFVANMSSTFRDLLEELYGLGARKFAIVNVPALGLTPPAVALNITPTLNDYARKFNEAEYAMLDELSSTLPGMNFSVGNAYVAVTDVVSNPEILDIKNVTGPCCGEVYYPPLKVIGCTVNATLCSNRSAYVFWDTIHPTQAVIEYAGTLFCNGSAPYASPINLQQLVEYESSRGGAGIGAVEVM